MASAGSSDVQVSETPSQNRVLVAEDNPVTRDLLRLLLTQRGYHVDLVGDGKAALNALKKKYYDIVLIDFHMPEMDGTEVVATYHAEGYDRRVPRFIAMTSDVNGLKAQPAKCKSFDSIMPKPFSLEDVCQSLEGSKHKS